MMDFSKKYQLNRRPLLLYDGEDLQNWSTVYFDSIKRRGLEDGKKADHLG